MSNKYTLSTNTKVVGGKTLYQIKANKSFNIVKEGELGGWVESENNLSQEGVCWVYGDAWVYGNALVYGDAWVYGDARVYGDALVCGNARVYGDALVCGNARVYGNTHVYGDARVYGNTHVYGDARVYGNAWVYGDARVYGDALVCGNARVYGDAWVLIGYITKSLEDKVYSLMAQLGVIPNQKGIITLYKKVNKVNSEYISEYDSSFKYVIGKTAVVKDVDMSNDSCASGIHLSTPLYWQSKEASTLLECQVHIDDVITVQQGKVRCSKVNVIREIEGIC
jgi:hypothetical protein